MTATRFSACPPRAHRAHLGPQVRQRGIPRGCEREAGRQPNIITLKIFRVAGVARSGCKATGCIQARRQQTPNGIPRRSQVEVAWLPRVWLAPQQPAPKGAPQVVIAGCHNRALAGLGINDFVRLPLRQNEAIRISFQRHPVLVGRVFKVELRAARDFKGEAKRAC